MRAKTPGTIRCVLINARSIINKMNVRLLFASHYVLDIICITESWGRLEVGDAELRIPNFVLFRSDRRDRRGGGVAIYVRDTVSAKVIEGINKNYEDVIGVCINPGSRDSLLVICCYRPESNSQDQNKSLYSAIRSASINSTNVVVVGDFNFRSIDWVNMNWPSSCDEFMEVVFDCGLIQFVYEPTRFENCLDLVFGKEDSTVINVSVREGLGISDHFSVFFECPLRQQRDAEKPKI